MGKFERKIKKQINKDTEDFEVWFEKNHSQLNEFSVKDEVGHQQSNGNLLTKTYKSRVPVLMCIGCFIICMVILLSVLFTKEKNNVDLTFGEDDVYVSQISDEEFQDLLNIYPFISKMQVTAYDDLRLWQDDSLVFTIIDGELETEDDYYFIKVQIEHNKHYEFGYKIAYQNLKNKETINGWIIILCGFIVLTGLKTVKVANAETNRQLTVEDYTNSDNLLKSDGTPSAKTIDEFAAEVKAADYDKEIPELSQVIPVEYLDKAIEGTFAYNGLEYGFYMVKYDLFFDLILIDFDYVSTKETDLEYKIRIKPILQESFYCQENSDGTYKWVKYGVIEKYFVANPRFMSVLLNENSLNYGDDGYDKLQDDGLIITQSRTNYGKVCYATEKDLINTIGEFAGNKQC